LREQFRGMPPSEFIDPEFGTINHINIPRLSQNELAQLELESPPLYSVVLSAPSELRELISVPFNLRLTAELLGAGLAPADLTPVRTQLQLLHRYWQHRIIRSDGQRDAREAILRHVCAGMVGNRRLRIDRATITDPGSSP